MPANRSRRSARTVVVNAQPRLPPQSGHLSLGSLGRRVARSAGLDTVPSADLSESGGAIAPPDSDKSAEGTVSRPAERATRRPSEPSDK